MLKCEYCGEEFKVTENLIKKRCPCDEDERMIRLDDWYFKMFRIDILVH